MMGGACEEIYNAVLMRPVKHIVIPYFATWFVLSASGEASESDAPTICLTRPSWRSMHGRNEEEGIHLDNNLDPIA